MGPAFLHKLHHEEDMEKRHDMVYQNARAYRDGFILFIDEFASPCPLTSPADIYEEGISRALLSKLTPLEQPNPAWHSFCYEAYPGDGSSNKEIVISLRRGLGGIRIREWSYALWDNQRLIEWNAFRHLLEFNEDDEQEAMYWSAFYGNAI